MTTAAGPALTAAQRMRDRIHGRSPHVRPDSQVPLPTRLAPTDVLMIHVADLPDRGPALDPVDGVATGPLALDGKPGSSP